MTAARSFFCPRADRANISKFVATLSLAAGSRHVHGAGHKQAIHSVTELPPVAMPGEGGASSAVASPPKPAAGIRGVPAGFSGDIAAASRNRPLAIGLFCFIGRP